MTKRKPKRKPKRIPNAEEVARSFKDAVKPWYDMAKGFGVPERDAEIMERGRTIGRLEGLADAFECPWDAKSIVGVSAQSRALLAPILRAEIERLKK